VALLYYDVANDRFQVVQGDDVDTAIPADAKAILVTTLAHGYDGSLWRKLVTDAAGYLKMTLHAQDVDLEVKQDTPADLRTGSHGWDGSAWRKLPMVWGYSDRWYEQVSNINAGAGNNDLSTAVVPSGYIYRAEWQVALNTARSPTTIWFASWAGATKRIYYEQPGSGQAKRAYSPIPVTLKAGDKIGVTIGGCEAGDDIYYRVWGYKMRVAE